MNRESLIVDPRILNPRIPYRDGAWHKTCGLSVIMANKLEELPIYPKVVAFWRAVNATLENPKLRRDCDLHEQISRANDSIPSNMVEGFEQGTDRLFANFLCYSKGSLAEVLKRLKKADFKKLITAEELKPHVDAGEELGKMLGGFIKYLRRCDWKDRGSHRRGQRRSDSNLGNRPPESADASDDPVVDDAPNSRFNDSRLADSSIQDE